MSDSIIIRGAKEHNLKNISLEIPRNKLVVFTGLSGSGKSTLAMDTLFAEGQRRYLESLSSYARQFLGQMERPDVESIDGLSPTIAIDQKAASHNPRSTVGTVTEIHDYLRLLYARIGLPHCPICGREIEPLSSEQMVERVLLKFESYGGKGDVTIYAPVIRERKGEYDELLKDFAKRGYLRARVDGNRQQTEEPVTLARYKKHSIDIVVDELPGDLDHLTRLTEAVELSLKLTDGLITIAYPDKTEETLNQKLACPLDGGTLPELEPRLFSFNSPQGACQTCDGLGVKREIDRQFIMPDLTKTLSEGGLLPWTYRPNNYYGWFLRQLCHHYQIPDNVRLKDLPQATLNLLLDGPPGGPERIPTRWQSKSGYEEQMTIRFAGFVKHLEDRYRRTESPTVREEIERYMAELPCPACQGARLRPEALLVTVGEKNLGELANQTVLETLAFFQKINLSAREKLISDRLGTEIENRLKFLVDVGLDYLTLDRAAMTLAGGEAQRIRLASQLGSALVGVLYILDEPTIGLHARDNRRLIATLTHLRDMGNTVVVIEHDQETIEAADWIVDIGPGAGRLGGEIVAEGPLSVIKQAPRSLTGAYLTGREVIPIATRRRPVGQDLLTVIGATEHNLKNVTISFPLQTFTAVTGVSGSGKSTLVTDILYRALARQLNRANLVPGRHNRIEGVEFLDKTIIIDQAPIGRTPRSNPATYTGIFTPIRELFAQTKDAKVRGYGPGRFSFNVSGGRCDACSGEGFNKVEMQFLPDVYLPCEVCKGERYNRETLLIRYKEKNIADILKMTIDEALIFFAPMATLHDRLQTLADVGLGYIQLGQAATTLSGGEAQRVKLSTELARRATGRTLYILDEPTTGLHFDDIRKLLIVLHRLVDHGNTVIVIEHNLDVIKTADWLIDLGPEGGAGGGKVIAEGTPETVSQESQSYTGQFLKPLLKL
ncbi:MAG: excinuclease ABC subunit UvrA [Patescibacteria group bacterium]